MSEALVSLAVAVVAGGAALNNRIHNRINSVHQRISALDRRLDGLELNVASDYVRKAELSELLSRMEDHMVRIENGLVVQSYISATLLV